MLLANCWTSSDTLSLIGLIISALTLLLGFCAYKRFLLQQAQQKQLSVVLDLIKTIHESKNLIEIHSGPQVSPMTTIHAYSIFEMVEQQSFQKDAHLYFYYPNGENLKWKFYTTFYTNPLLPNKIAQALSKFNIDHKSAYVRSSVFNEEGIIIGNVTDPIPGSKIFYVDSLDQTLNKTSGFRKAVSELKESIVEWLEDYGINDINLINR